MQLHLQFSIIEACNYISNFLNFLLVNYNNDDKIYNYTQMQIYTHFLLSYGKTATGYYTSSYGSSGSVVHQKHFHCRGTEEDLLQCDIYNISSGLHIQDAGISCYGICLCKLDL